MLTHLILLFFFNYDKGFWKCLSKMIWLRQEMAAASLLTCSFQEGTCFAEIKASYKSSICNHVNFMRKSSYCFGLMSIRGEKSSKLEKTKIFSKRKDAVYRAVEIENPPFTLGNKFQFDDVIESQQFDRDILNAIFKVAQDMEKIEKNSSGSQILRGHLMATLFYEPSTRTRLSFESAMKRLGGEVLTTENAREFSSAAKGETLEGNQSLSFLLSWSLEVVYRYSLVIMFWMCRYYKNHWGLLRYNCYASLWERCC